MHNHDADVLRLVAVDNVEHRLEPRLVLSHLLHYAYKLGRERGAGFPSGLFLPLVTRELGGMRVKNLFFHIAV